MKKIKPLKLKNVLSKINEINKEDKKKNIMKLINEKKIRKLQNVISDIKDDKKKGKKVFKYYTGFRKSASQLMRPMCLTNNYELKNNKTLKNCEHFSNLNIKTAITNLEEFNFDFLANYENKSHENVKLLEDAMRRVYERKKSFDNDETHKTEPNFINDKFTPDLFDKKIEKIKKVFSFISNFLIIISFF